MEDSFGFNVGCQFLAVFEDVLHRCNLERIIVMTRRAPSNACFQPIPPQILDLEDVLLEVSEETPIGFLASDFECSSDVLQKVHMADLDNHSGEHVLRCHADRIVLIAGNALEGVVHVLEFREELDHGLEVLGRCEKADGNVVGNVIHAVDEGDFLVVALHGHVLPVDDQ